MPRTTPFHRRTEPINRTGIWKHWSGYLVAPQYGYSLTDEYYAIRNAVSLLDTSPLFKYRFRGDDGLRVLRRALARDAGAVRAGRAQYTCWCDERGFVRQDGVLLHLDEDEYRLTAAEPALKYSGTWPGLWGQTPARSRRSRTPSGFSRSRGRTLTTSSAV